MTTQTVIPVGGIAGAWRGDLRETSGLGALVRRLRHRIAAHARYRETYEELQLLSDRELSDIGVARADIGRIAQQAVADALGTAAHRG